MKGTEHFRAAEQRLEFAFKISQPGSGLTDEQASVLVRLALQRAQVHAILAAATAVSNLVTVWGDIAKMMRADSELPDAEPPRAEPLVTCGQPGESGLLHCCLPVGHDGQHADKNDLGTIKWTQDDAETFEHQQLVTCNAAPAGDGLERCGLAIGHDGMHEHDTGGYRIVCWSTPAELRNLEPALLYESTATDLHMEMPR